MENISSKDLEFYNRERELSLLKEDRKRNLRVAIIGRRRIGKTTLVKRAIKDVVMLFVPQHKSEKIIIKEWSEEYDFIPLFDNFKSLFDYLFRNFNEYTYFIDEFQNLVRINKSILSDMQYLIDKYNPSLIITGSLVSMMKEIVEDYKSPLYGRFDHIIRLRELDPLVCIRWGRDLGLTIQEAIKLWSVIGGMPKYWQLFSKMNKKEVEEFIIQNFISYPRPLYKEIEIMLKEEFGKEHKIYFSILEAISQGRNSLGEISNYIGIQPTNLTKYLYVLNHDHEIIKREIPLCHTKRGIYVFNSNMFEFWFKYLYRYQYLLENEEEEEHIHLFKKTFNAYVGRKFENFAHHYLSKKLRMYKIGKWWHKDKEIDIVAINEQKKEMLAVEAKWQDLKLRDVKRIMEELEEKVEEVRWYKEERRVKLGVFAKSMEKKAREWLEQQGYKGWDLRDVENWINNSSVK